MLLPAWVLLGAGMIGFDRTPDVFPLNFLWLAVICAGLVLFVLLGMFEFGRYAIGLHYIVDRNVGCLTALRRTANYTRGNGFTIAMLFLLLCVRLFVISFVLVPFGILIVINILPIILLPIALYPLFLFPLFLALIVGLGLLFVIACLHCWLAVTYHLTTGQYEIPNTAKTQEW